MVIVKKKNKKRGLVVVMGRRVMNFIFMNCWFIRTMIKYTKK